MKRSTSEPNGGASAPFSVIAQQKNGDPAFESPDYLHTIIDSLQDELIVIDKNYCIIEANAPFLARHGKSRQEVLKQSCYVIAEGATEPCPAPLSRCPITSVFKTGRSFHNLQERDVPIGDGEERRYFDIVASPIFGKGEKITAVAVLMRDVTETKELELGIAKAQENLAALNRIATVVTKSLDLDTVLNSSLEMTLETMQCSSGGIMLIDEESQTLSYRAHRGLSNHYSREMRLAMGEGISGMVAKTGQSFLVNDITRDSRAARIDLLNAEGITTFACVPLFSKEKILGILNITSNEPGKLSEESLRLLESIAGQIAIAIDNARLHQEVQQKEAMRGELLQDIFAVQEEERRRIARELHDETSQVLASLSGNLEAASAMLSEKDERARAILKKAQALSIEVLDETHRLIYELRPTLLDDMGLIAATRWLITNILEEAGIKVEFKVAGNPKRLTQQVETTLFRVTQEAANNIARHSKAKKASVRLQFKRNLVIVRVKDNGRGFDVEEAISSKERPRGLGLIGMRERVELIEGTLHIDSEPKNGTEITIEIPIRQEVINEQD